MAEPLSSSSYFDQPDAPSESDEAPTIDHPVQDAAQQLSPVDALTKHWDSPNESSPGATEDFRGGVGGGESVISAEVVDESDTSIEDYMSQLLDRVNNGIEASQSAVGETQPPPTPSKTQAEAPEPTEPREPAASMTAELRQPKKAPEDRDGLKKMREVANVTAQSALQTHHCRGLVAQMYGKLSFILVACILSSVLALLAPSIASIQYGVAIVAMVLTSVGAWSYVKMAQRLSKMVESPLK